MWFYKPSDEKKHSRRLRELIEFGRPKPSNGYINCLGISTHPQCYFVCVHRKRATAEECLNHPWLNPQPSPHSHPHLNTVMASSLDEPELSQSESEPESPALSPELGSFGSFLMCPGQGDLKAGRDAFSFSEPPFPTRPEIKQELICWPMFHLWWGTRWIQTEWSRGWEPVSLRLQGPCSAAALRLAAFTAVMSLSWAVCSFVPLSVLWLCSWTD